MIDLVDILEVIYWNLCIPTLIGYLITRFLKQDSRDNLALNFVIGFAAVLGIFQPIALIAIYLKTSLSLLILVMKILWLALSVVSLALNWKRLWNCLKKIPIALKGFNFFLVAAVVLILIQAYVYVEYEHIDDDDAFYVAMASTSIANDNLYRQSPYSGLNYSEFPSRYVLSPFSIYYAVISELTGVHPTIYAHVFLPLVLLLFVYVVYYLWGKEWFEDNKYLGVFLILISFLNIFGGYSENTTQSFMLMRLWQGKAFLAAGLIPFVLYLCYKIRKEENVWCFWLILFLVVSASSHVSSMGVFLAPISIGCFALADLIQTRKIKRSVGYLISCFPCIVCGIIYIIIS
ncbi:DUF6077 domain-containing protein [Konateibacter massiliensis]|uniref:DUF6077 domain-containing protein n=1 Tax=Konateibacter massiliensis TaxID=2002841 RepID=UPI000C14E446|nr:DUF6077 domain-containing protein [Konateibacter massiliensis]